MKSGGIIRQRNRFARRCKQRIVVRRAFKNAVKLGRQHFRIAAHERHFAADFARENELRLPRPAQRQQITSKIGIAGNAEGLALGRLPRCDQLPDHIDADIEHVSHCVSVIR